jgi:type IV pilus assembly protein PilA
MILVEKEKGVIIMLAILKNRKGVTLVELLAVLVIMGIIAAIAVPTIGGLIESSKQKAAEASYTAVLSAAQNYVSGEGLEASDTFTSTDLVTDEYLDADPFGAVVTFTVGANSSVTITAPTGAITIDGYTVFTVS